MLRKNQRTSRGAWRINTAQAVIFLIAIGCAVVIYGAYQKSGEDPTPTIDTVTLPNIDPRHARYAAEVKKWQTKLAAQQMTLTWPYNNLDNVVRLDLPDKVPVTLADWDENSERRIAKQAYYDFVRVRSQARADNKILCIVHLFAPVTAPGVPPGTMEEVAQASAAGVSTSTDQSLGGGSRGF